MFLNRANAINAFKLWYNWPTFYASLIMNDFEEFETFEEGGPSKSERKREMDAVQELAIKLAGLPADELAQLPIPDELGKALSEYKRMKSHGAIVRQAQFLGKVMRKVNSEAIIEAYDTLQLKQKCQLQQAEQWRLRLMEEDKAALTEFINEFPEVNRQKLRQLIKDAVMERDNDKHSVIQKGIQKSAQKKLFRFLNQGMGQV